MAPALQQSACSTTPVCTSLFESLPIRRHSLVCHRVAGCCLLSLMQPSLLRKDQTPATESVSLHDHAAHIPRPSNAAHINTSNRCPPPDSAQCTVSAPQELHIEVSQQSWSESPCRRECAAAPAVYVKRRFSCQ